MALSYTRRILKAFSLLQQCLPYLLFVSMKIFAESVDAYVLKSQNLVKAAHFGPEN